MAACWLSESAAGGHHSCGLRIGLYSQFHEAAAPGVPMPGMNLRSRGINLRRMCALLIWPRIDKKRWTDRYR